MPVFVAIAAAATAIGTAIAGAVAGITLTGVASFAARTLLTIGISKLIANRANKTAAGTQDSGARVQLPPATNNKLPVVYGKAYIAPVITDAKISTDQRYMWYVCTLAEVTSGSGYTFGDIYW
jgi:predicted phage tail protein